MSFIDSYGVRPDPSKLVHVNIFDRINKENADKIMELVKNLKNVDVGYATSIQGSFQVLINLEGDVPQSTWMEIKKLCNLIYTG